MIIWSCWHIYNVIYEQLFQGLIIATHQCAYAYMHASRLCGPEQIAHELQVRLLHSTAVHIFLSHRQYDLAKDSAWKAGKQEFRNAIIQFPSEAPWYPFFLAKSGTALPPVFTSIVAKVGSLQRRKLMIGWSCFWYECSPCILRY